MQTTSSDELPSSTSTYLQRDLSCQKQLYTTLQG